MAKTADIKAGGAFIELYVKGQQMVKAGLDSVGSTYRRFSATVSAQAKIAQKTIVACNRAIARSAALTKRGMAGASKLGQSANAAGRAAMIGGGAGALAMGVSASTYMGFEKEMSKVSALTQASGDEYEKLVALAKELGATTEYTAQNAAEGMSFLGMAGFKTNQILAATPVLLDAATAAGMDLGRTADIMSDVGQAFGISADEIERVADVLSVTAMNANTNVEMMGTSFQYVAASAKVAGQPIEEVAAALAIMANSGIKASKAGTGLRAMLAVVGSDLGKKKLLREFGVSAWDAQGNIKPLLTIIQELDKAMTGLSTGQKAAKLNLVFGKIAGNAVGTLANNAGSIDKYRDLTFNQRDGATKKMAATMRDNLWGSWKGLVSAVESVQIAIGEAITGELRGFIDTVTTISRALAKWVKDNKEIVVTVGKVAVAVAGIGAGVVAVGTLIGGVGAIVTPLISAVASFGAVGVGALGAIVAVGVSALGTLGSLITSVIGMVGMLAGGFVLASQAVGRFLVFLGPLIASVNPWIAGLAAVLASLGAVSLTNFGVNVFGALGKAVINVTGSIVGCFKGLGESIWAAVGETGNAFARIFVDAKKLVSELAVTFSSVWDALKSGDANLAMEIVWTEIELRFEQGKQYLIGVFEEFSKIAQKLLAGIQQAFTDMFNGLKDSMYEFLASLNYSKNKTLYANLLPDINLDEMRKEYHERNKEKQLADSPKIDALLLRGVSQEEINSRVGLHGRGEIDKMIAEYKVDMVAAKRQGAKRDALIDHVEAGKAITTTKGAFGYKKESYANAKEGHNEMKKSIRHALDYDGEAGLDELLRRNGLDPKKYETIKHGLSSSLPSPPSVTPAQIASQKRVADLQAKREGLLKQAKTEKEPAKKSGMPVFNNRFEKELFERYQFPKTAKEFKEWSDKLTTPVQGRQEKFSEKALRAKPRTSVFDMVTGGGTFSGYEMGNLGGNRVTQMLDDQLSQMRSMNTSLNTLVKEAEGGGFG